MSNHRNGANRPPIKVSAQAIACGILHAPFSLSGHKNVCHIRAIQSLHSQRSSHFTGCLVTRVLIVPLQRLHSLKPNVKRIHPFYLNRGGGVTSLLHLLGVLLQLLRVPLTLDCISQAEHASIGKGMTNFLRVGNERGFQEENKAGAGCTI